MWELRRDRAALSWLEAHYAEYSDRCLACRLQTKVQAMKEFGKTHPKSARHVRQERARAQQQRWRRARGLPALPRECPFAAYFRKNVAVPIYKGGECCDGTD